ncbi:putative ribonuclease H-like domain-containing protein [Tanacetum coccineum]
MLSNSPLSSSTQSTYNKDADEVLDKGDDDVIQRNGQEKEGGASNKKDDQHVQDFRAELDNLLVQQKEGYANSTNRDSTASLPISTVRPSINTASENINTDVGAKANLNNLETTMNVSPIPITRIHKDHTKNQIIGDINSATQTRRMIKISEEHAMDFRNKKDERGIVIRNKARLVAQGYTQEEGIDYDEVFALVSKIEAIRLFLACASFMWFIVYQMDVKSAFLYGTIEEEVEKALYGLHQAPRAWYETLSTYLLENGFRRGTIDKTLFIKTDKGDILTASTPMEPNKELVKDEEAKNVDVHLYRSIIGSLMYLTASRPDITFVVCACARFQVTPKVSHLHAVKRIFRYLKSQHKLGLWYPRDSPFDLEAFLTVIMLELALIGNPQQEVVNFLAKG